MYFILSYVDQLKGNHWLISIGTDVVSYSSWSYIMTTEIKETTLYHLHRERYGDCGSMDCCEGMVGVEVGCSSYIFVLTYILWQNMDYHLLQ